MKKYPALLFLIVAITSLGFTQGNISKTFSTVQLERKLSSTPRSSDTDFFKKPSVNNKAFRDTLFYTSFSNGLPSGWSIVNNNTTNSFQWEWDTIYRPGQFSLNTNVITSTSATDGFMSLTADLFNTPIPPGGAVAMDTYFESAPIDLTNNGTNPNGVGAVWVSYQQTLRYCCSGTNKLVLQVSTDNFVTFTEYDATNAMPISSASGTFSNVIDISAAANNSATIKIRFLSEGNSHYYWMIDDFAVIEGPDFDMGLSNAYPIFNSNYFISPFYSQIPMGLFNSLTFSGIITNEGGAVASNARLEVTVINDSMQILPNLPKTVGAGVQYFDTQTSVPANLPSNASDTIVIGNSIPFINPKVYGDYTIDFLANSDSINLNPLNESESFIFSITDTTLAKDDDSLTGSLSPASFVRNGIPGGTAVGDELSTLFIIEPNPYATFSPTIPTSVSFLVSNDFSNIGVEIMPVMYSFNGSAPTMNTAIGPEVASSFLPFMIQATHLGTWLTLPFDNGTGFWGGLTPGQYIVGWKTTSITGGKDFSVQEDLSSGRRQPFPSTFVNFGHSPGWGSIAPTNPGIRLNIYPSSLVSLNETGVSEIDFRISPNPNNGKFKIDVTTNSNTPYTLNIRSILGQIIYTEKINVNGQFKKQLDLSPLGKGVYFVSLENEAEKVVKKVILK